MAKKIVSRSAKTGKFVTKRYAAKHPATTVRERVKTGKSTTSGTGPRKK